MGEKHEGTVPSGLFPDIAVMRSDYLAGLGVKKTVIGKGGGVSKHVQRGSPSAQTLWGLNAKEEVNGVQRKTLITQIREKGWARG